MSSGEGDHASGLFLIQFAVNFPIFTGTLHCGPGHAARKVRRFVQLLQALTPEPLPRHRVLLLQPGNVLGKRRANRRQGLALAGLQYLVEHQRVTPAVHQDVVACVNQVPTIFGATNQCHPQ